MSRIDSIHINNFKFFDKQEPIKLGGKHLLLFGENGSGKSSVYWALYTLFESAAKKDITDFIKYFLHPDIHNESLINIHAPEQTAPDSTKHFDSFIKLTTTHSTPIEYEVSLLNTSISGNTDAIEVNKASDFINYKILYKFQDFWNGESMNLARIFEGYVLPYVRFPEINIYREGRLQPRTSAYDMWEEITIGPGTTTNAKNKTIQAYKHSDEFKQFEVFVNHFNRNFRDLIDFINANAPDMLKKIGYDIDFNLQFHDATYKKGDTQYNYNRFKIDLNITSYLGKTVNIHRPQSFLNEAKITAIAIAIRLTILKKRINEQVPDLLKFIVFDDFMISLDMNNRDKVIDYLLNPDNKFTSDYQLLFLTHDKNLFDFISYKINQWDNKENWVYKEMYAGKNTYAKKEYPIIIDSELNNLEKARKHFDGKDYVACSIYLRKELEKVVNERIPDELKYKSDGSFLSLQSLWSHLIDRYNALNKPITVDIQNNFKQSKLLILNPQAHFQYLSMPVYKVELERVFNLISDLKTNYPIPQNTILLSKGMKLQFKHPHVNYTFDFELLGDFYFDNLNGVFNMVYPKCKVIHWQYDGTEFHCPSENKTLNKYEITKVLEREDRLNKLLKNLKKDTLLGITNDLFRDNTIIINSIWSLRDVLTKANISI